MGCHFLLEDIFPSKSLRVGWGEAVHQRGLDLGNMLRVFQEQLGIRELGLYECWGCKWSGVWTPKRHVHAAILEPVLLHVAKGMMNLSLLRGGVYPGLSGPCVQSCMYVLIGQTHRREDKGAGSSESCERRGRDGRDTATSQELQTAT